MVNQDYLSYLMSTFNCPKESAEEFLRKYIDQIEAQVGAAEYDILRGLAAHYGLRPQ